MGHDEAPISINNAKERNVPTEPDFTSIGTGFSFT